MNIQRGEIYFVNLNPIKGKEQAGNRPVLVLSIDHVKDKLGIGNEEDVVQFIKEAH